MQIRCESCHKVICQMPPSGGTKTVIQLTSGHGKRPVTIKAMDVELTCPHCGHEGRPLPQLVESKEEACHVATPRGGVHLAAA